LLVVVKSYLKSWEGCWFSKIIPTGGCEDDIVAFAASKLAGGGLIAFATDDSVVAIAADDIVGSSFTEDGVDIGDFGLGEVDGVVAGGALNKVDASAAVDLFDGMVKGEFVNPDAVVAVTALDEISFVRVFIASATLKGVASPDP